MAMYRSVGFALICLAVSSCSPKIIRPIRVGSKNFPEQVLLGEIIAQVLERQLGLAVNRDNLNKGSTLEVHHAMLAGEVDVYPEYSGTAFTAILKHSWTGQETPESMHARIRDEYEKAMDLAWLDPLGFEDPWGMFVKKDAKSRPASLTEAVSSGKMGLYRLVVGQEFLERPDGFASLIASYPLQWRSEERRVGKEC